MSSELRKTMRLVCQRLDQRCFVANHDGNVSVQLPDSRFLVTPTARGKGELQESDFLVISRDGNTLEGAGKVFSEWSVHRAIYDATPDAQCVVHAHPAALTALGIERRALIVDYIPEALVSLGGDIPVLYREVAANENLAERLKPVLAVTVAFLIEGNGIFAYGHELLTTYYRIELAEHVAGIMSRLKSGDQWKLPPAVRADCLKKHRQVLLNAKNALRPVAAPAQEASQNVVDMEDIVTRVLDALR